MLLEENPEFTASLALCHPWHPGRIWTARDERSDPIRRNERKDGSSKGSTKDYTLENLTVA
jgi:hypothetical protein